MVGDGNWHLGLFSRWRLERAGQEVTVPLRQQRVIAATALLGQRPREMLAGLLWPDSTDVHATQSLRSCLWQINHGLPGVLAPCRNAVRLGPEVRTDLEKLREYRMECSAGRPPDLVVVALDFVSSASLLPGWYEDWVVVEQERIDRIRLHMLESLAQNQMESGDYDNAVEAAETASLVDPYRESAQRILIKVHLAAGNPASALRTYGRFRDRMVREFGVQPSAEMRALLQPLH